MVLKTLQTAAALAMLAGFSSCQANSGGAEQPPGSAAGSRSPWRSGSGQADLLPEAGFYVNSEKAPLYAMIDGARSSLDVEIYQMSDPDVKAGLRRALKRGVHVRVIKEPRPNGDSCDVFAGPKDGESADCADQKMLRTEIQEQGGVYIPFDKATFCPQPSKPCSQHGKMVIADENAALVSTGNFNSTNLCNLNLGNGNPDKCNRDFSVVTRDSEVLLTLSRIFEGDLARRPYDLKALLQGSVADKLTVSPLSLEPLIKFIASAKNSIRVQNQYLKEPALNDALMQAARRGVHVEIVTASACSFGHPSSSDINSVRKIYGQFDSAGIASRMFSASIAINGKPGYLHSKAIVIDDERAWVGSVNGSTAAVSNNREFGLFFAQPKWVSALVEIMNADFSATGAETWEESLSCAKDFAEAGR